MGSLGTFFIVISVIMLLLTLASWLGKLSSAGLTVTKWFLISIGALLMLWGLYNTLGQRLGLWQPISLDAYLKPFTDAVEQFVEWLWNALARLIKR